MKKVFALLITGVLAASMLAGCGGNSSSSNDKSSAAETTAAQTTVPETTVAPTTANDLIAGKWVNGAFSVEGTEYTLDEYAQAFGLTADDITVNYEFDAQGKATCSWPLVDMAVEGTYTFDGKTIEATFVNEQGNSVVKFDYDATKDTLSATDANTGVVTVMVRAGAVAEGVQPTESVAATEGVQPTESVAATEGDETAEDAEVEETTAAVE